MEKYIMSTLLVREEIRTSEMTLVCIFLQVAFQNCKNDMFIALFLQWTFILLQCCCGILKGLAEGDLLSCTW
jgi:hypothetical protein